MDGRKKKCVIRIELVKANKHYIQHKLKVHGMTNLEALAVLELTESIVSDEIRRGIK